MPTPMTINDVCLVKQTSDLYYDGKVYIQEWSVDFDGDWDADLLERGTDGTFEWPILGDRLVTASSSSSSSSGGLDPLFGVFCAQWKAEHSTDVAAKLGKITATFKQDANLATVEKDACQYKYGREQRDTYIDRNDRPLVNQAGQIFSTPGKARKTIVGAVITGYRSTVKLPPINSRWAIVNSNDFSLPGGVDVGAGEAEITDATVEQVYIQGAKRWKHVWTLSFDKDHDLHVPNMGTMERVGGTAGSSGGPATGGNLRPIVRNGERVRQPWPLNLAGEALPDGYSVDDIVKIDFDMTEDFDFDTFGWTFE